MPPTHSPRVERERPARARPPARAVSDRLLSTALVGLSLVGAGVAGYVLSTRWADTHLACSTGGCETVQSSQYAEILGAPVAAVGVLGYLLVGAVALFAGPRARATVAALALGAVLFSAYLLVVHLVVIEAVCDWCVANDVIATLVACVALVRLRASQTASV